MSFGRTAAQYDVAFHANTGQFRAETSQIKQEWARTTGALSNDTLKAAIAQEKLDRAIKKHGPTSLAAKQETVRYAESMERLSLQAGRTGRSVNTAERDVERFGRGVLAGSGIMGKFGRAAIFASSSVLGGYGLVYALRTVLSAAREGGVALSQVENAVRNAGLSWRQYGRDIEQATQRLVKSTAFQDDEIEAGLATLIRRFGNVPHAIDLAGAAADAARGRNLDYASAITLVIKAANGQSGALRRLGLDVTKVTSSQDALAASGVKASAQQKAAAKAADDYATRESLVAALRAKYHRQAADYLKTDAGKQALFNAELHQSEQIIGRALLPTLNVWLGDLTTWLVKMNESGRLQHDVNRVVQDGVLVLHGLHDVYAILKPIIHEVNTALGGTEHAVRDLALAWLALKANKIAAGLGLIGSSAGEAGAAGKVGLLTSRLSALKLIGQIALTITVNEIIKKLGFGDALSLGDATAHDNFVGKNPFPKGSPGYEAFKAGAHGVKPDRRGEVHLPSGITIPATNKDYRAGRNASPAHRPGAHGKSNGAGAGAGSGSGGGGVRSDVSAALDNRLLDAQINTPTNFADDRAAFEAQRSYLLGLLNQKGLTQTNIRDIKQRLLGIVDQIRGIDQNAAATAKAAVAKYRAGVAAHAKRLETAAKLELAHLIKSGVNKAPNAAAIIAGAPKATALHDFLEREAHDAKLSAGGRASYAAAIASERLASARALNAELTKQRKHQIGQLTKIPVELQIQEKLAKTEQQKLVVLNRELAAVQAQVEKLKKLNAGKAAIQQARLTEAGIQQKINQLKPTGSAAAFFDEAANEFDLYSSNAGRNERLLSRQGARAQLAKDALVDEVRGLRAEVRHLTRHAKRTADSTGTIVKQRPTLIHGARMAAAQGY